MESEVENHKINIITNKIILNYINNETLLHMRELLGCLQLDTSKVKVLEKALEQEEKLQEKIKRGELPKEYEKKDEKGNLYVIKNTVFDEKGKMFYLNPVVPQLFFMMTVVLLIRNHFLTMFA